MQIQTRSGAMVLMTVLIMGATALTIALMVSLRGISELDMGFSENQSLETLAGADGCAEEALLRVGRNGAYTGATLTVDETECAIVVTNVDGTERRIDITATMESWTRSVRIGVDTSDMTILEWVQN